MNDEKNKNLSDEIQRRLQALKIASQDFVQLTNLIDGNYENRMAEIKTLELKRDRLKDEVDESTKKANSIIQEATEQAYNTRKEANDLLDGAKMAKLQAKQEQEEAVKFSNQAQAQLQQAQARQREADTAYRVQEERANRIKQALV